MNTSELLKHIRFTKDIEDVLKNAPEVLVPQSRSKLLTMVFGDDTALQADVVFDVPGKGPYKEAYIARCKNGVAVNFCDTYMRRRDPNAMVIADELPTDKKTYKERFNADFSTTRKETLEWLKTQRLFAMPFYAGDAEHNYLSVAIAPVEAAFFILALADLQGFILPERLPSAAKIVSAFLVAPPFRHTHFDGKQVVVHNRSDEIHEVFSYNLYPGPSAKKGVYSMLLNIGEREVPPWSTLHCSTVRIVTPYECELVIMHEGASGGGKTEMTQDPHLNNGGMMTLAYNPDTEDSTIIDMKDTCELFPLTDDMGLVHHREQTGRKIRVQDAEEAWFLRVDHLKQYGTDPKLEALCISPPEPLIFLNIEGKPGATALIWDHTLDAPDTPCPNPRIILPRKYVPNVISDIVSVDIRSMGVRTPRCTRSEPSYGIIGVMHVLPPALAWIWRLIAPRGHANPSIVAAGKALTSEGVGSYWPFAIGRRVDQANLLLRQIQETPETGYLLIPNQFIGAYKVGFNAEWLAREYTARRGGIRYRRGQLMSSRCSLLGFSPSSLKFNSAPIPRGLLRVEEQQEVGYEAYDAGALELVEFFKKELEPYRSMKDLSPLGKAIVDVVFNNGTVEDYMQALPFNTAALGLS